MFKVDGVFQGGGIKGIAFVGAVYGLEERGAKWERLAGTSAGAIIASLLAVGYTGRELKSIMMDLNYKKLLDKSGVSRLPIAGSTLSILLKKGIYDGDYIEDWLESLLEKKGKNKFKHISKNGESRLKIIASDITNKKMLILPEDIKEYGIDPMEFSIAKAVRMSIGIPFYFKPIIINNKDRNAYIVDGGLLSNFPIWIFDVKGNPRWPTFGFKFSEKPMKKEPKIYGVMGFIKEIIEAMVNNYDEMYLSDKDRVRTINISTLGVKTTEFNISRQKSLELFNEGYKASSNFFRNWNFESYVRKHRNVNNYYNKSSKIESLQEFSMYKEFTK